MPEIELKRIQPNRLNPRLEFRKQALDELADSIKLVGLLEPIIVRPDGKNAFEVVVGERRYRAAQQANLKKVPVIIRNYTDEQVLELNLIENIQREDLSAVEKAKVCQQLRERFPRKFPSWDSIAERVGVDKRTIYFWVQTLSLPEPVQRLIAPRTTERVPKGKIDFQTAIHIARAAKEPKKQIELARELSQKHLPGPSAREFLKEVARKPDKPVQQIMRQVIEEAPISLPFSKPHAEAIVRGKKTQTSRKSKDPRLQKGAVVKGQVTHFADLKITDVYRKRLGGFDEQDAKAEGGYTLAEFKKVWRSIHGRWDPDETVYVIHFRLLKVIGEEA